MVAFPTLVSMILIGVWHGAGTQFLLFGLFHSVYLTTNHAWRIFRAKPASQTPRGRARMNHAASVLLTLLCVIVAQVLFRADSTRGAFAMFASMTGRGGLGVHALEPLYKAMLLIPLLFLAVWTLPNTQQILRRFGSGVSTAPRTAAPRRMLLWRPAVTWGLAIAAAFIVCLAYMEDTSRFLYFQF
jgi:hypothetical protein